MAEFVDVVVDTAQQGGQPVAEVSSRDGSKPTPAEKPGRAKPSGPGDRLTVVADTHAVAHAGRVLKDSTREKIAAIVQAHREAPADEPDEEPSVEVEDVADTIDPADDDDEPIDAMAAPPAKAPEKAPPKAVPPDVEERLKELEGVAERQRAALERYEAQLAEARKAGEETAAQRAARLDAAEAEYLSDPVKALHRYVAGVLGVDDENHDDVKKEVADLFLDLTAHVSGATQETSHLAKRQSDRTRREWEREKRGRAASGKKDAEAAAKREREQHVDGIVGQLDGVIKTSAEKYPHLTSLAPLLDGKSAGRVIWEVVERGIARGDFKADEDDEVLIAKAAKVAEQHYTKRADPIRSALNPKKPSTATTPTASTKEAPAAQVEREKPRERKEARVTNADASVAPATPPAQKPAPKTIPLQNDEQRRRHALRHLRKR